MPLIYHIVYYLVTPSPSKRRRHAALYGRFLRVTFILLARRHLPAGRRPRRWPYIAAKMCCHGSRMTSAQEVLLLHATPICRNYCSLAMPRFEGLRIFDEAAAM